MSRALYQVVTAPGRGAFRLVGAAAFVLVSSARAGFANDAVVAKPGQPPTRLSEAETAYPAGAALARPELAAAGADERPRISALVGLQEVAGHLTAWP